QEAQRLSPDSRPSSQIDAREDQEHQCRSEKGINKEDRSVGFQPATFRWHIKKDRAALRMAATASASGWVWKNSAAKGLSPAISLCGSAAQNFCLGKTSDSGGIIQFLRGLMEACASTVPGAG